MPGRHLKAAAHSLSALKAPAKAQASTRGWLWWASLSSAPFPAVEGDNNPGESPVNLIQKLAEPPVTRPLGKSVMDLWVESRPENEQAAILVAASNPVWGHVALLRELVAEGAPSMSDTAFRAWRIKRGLES